MPRWKIVYNDGTTITTASSSKGQKWNLMPKENVQFVLIYRCGARHILMGQDTYNLDGDGITEEKTGKLISDAEFTRTRNFMIYGKY
jgi:hypothetical protein